MADNSRERKEAPQVVLTGSNIRFETAKSSRRPKPSKSKVAVTVVQERTPVGGFLGFMREYAVVGLIIGFVLGTQVQSLVKQLVQSFLDPLTQLFFGSALSNRTFTLHFHAHSASFGWGSMAYAIIIFLLVLLTMYVVIKLFKLDKLEKPKEEA